jgi:MiaB/RimO family radical SAM methylthiotransferase
MNVSDTEIVRSILSKAGMDFTEEPADADVILLNTCAVRENAEQKVWNRLRDHAHLKRREKFKHKSRPQPPVVGVLGCMAERLKTKILEKDKSVDLVVGPDAYRDLPRLLSLAADGAPQVNTQLSLDETYADVAPVRVSANKVSAFVSIMRGCDNMCSFCIVPFTRGRERSRCPDSICEEVRLLALQGYREVTLLGQNVNSYHFLPEGRQLGQLEDTREAQSGPGFMNITKRTTGSIGVRFTELLARVAAVHPEVRVRFTSPHPKDFPPDLIELMRITPNVAKQIHLPLQAGSTEVLARMRRGYSKDAYLELAGRLRSRIPGVALSTDVIAGFCGESDADHADTLEVLRTVAFETAFHFKYSQRERTHAHRTLQDDVPEAVKQRRLEDIIAVCLQTRRERLAGDMGKSHLVLVERVNPKSPDELAGRTDCAKAVVFKRQAVPVHASVLTLSTSPGVLPGSGNPADEGNISVEAVRTPVADALSTACTAMREPAVGEYVEVRVTDASSGATLRAEAVRIISLQAFAASRE